MSDINIYIFLFIVKTIGGALSNYRLILMKEGNRIGATIVTGLSTFTWVLSMALVVDNIQENLLVAVPFVLAVVCGNYLGSTLDSFFSSGNTMTTIIASEKNEKLIELIKKSGFDVITVPAKGRDANKKVIMINSTRKKQKTLSNILNNDEFKSCVIYEKVEEVC